MKPKEKFAQATKIDNKIKEVKKNIAELTTIEQWSKKGTRFTECTIKSITLVFEKKDDARKPPSVEDKTIVFSSDSINLNRIMIKGNVESLIYALKEELKSLESQFDKVFKSDE